MHSSLRVNDVVPKKELAWCGVAPFSPTGNAWEYLSAFFQEACPVDAIESVSRIDFHEDRVGIVSVSMAPLAGDQ